MAILISDKLDFRTVTLPCIKGILNNDKEDINQNDRIHMYAPVMVNFACQPDWPEDDQIKLFLGVSVRVFFV